MKRSESAFQISKPSLLRRVKQGGAGLNVLDRLKPKARTLAAILVPCLLQLPLVAFGQERPNDVDRSFVPLKATCERVDSKAVVGNGGDLRGESQLVGVGGNAKIACPTGLTARQDAKEDNSQRSSGAKKESFSGGKKDSEYFHVIAITFVWWVLAALIFAPWPWRER